MATTKNKMFIAEYLKDFNATQSAIRAGYSKKTSYSIGQELLKKPEIKKIIRQELDNRLMCADEVLLRLANMARINVNEFIDDDGEIRIDKVKKYGHLVKSITPTKFGIKIELHDNKSALDSIDKYHALFTDVTVKVERELEDALTRFETNLSDEDYIKVIEALKK